MDQTHTCDQNDVHFRRNQNRDQDRLDPTTEVEVDLENGTTIKEIEGGTTIATEVPSTIAAGIESKEGTETKIGY